MKRIRFSTRCTRGPARPIAHSAQLGVHELRRHSRWWDRTRLQRVHHARRGQTTHPQCVPVDGPCGVRGLPTAPRLPPTAWRAALVSAPSAQIPEESGAARQRTVGQAAHRWHRTELPPFGCPLRCSSLRRLRWCADRPLPGWQQIRRRPQRRPRLRSAPLNSAPNANAA